MTCHEVTDAWARDVAGLQNASQSAHQTKIAICHGELPLGGRLAQGSSSGHTVAHVPPRSSVGGRLRCSDLVHLSPLDVGAILVDASAVYPMDAAC